MSCMVDVEHVLEVIVFKDAGYDYKLVCVGYWHSHPGAWSLLLACTLL